LRQNLPNESGSSALIFIHKDEPITMHFKRSNLTVCRVNPDATTLDFDQNKACT
jgi:hypothetical protein